MNKLNLYDVTQEAIQEGPTVSGVDAYATRGYNTTHGVYIVPAHKLEATQAQQSYIKEIGLNPNPATLIPVETNSLTLTHATMQQAADIRQQIRHLGLTELMPFMYGELAQKVANSLDLKTPYSSVAHAHHAVERSNNKGQILSYFAQQGLNVPKGRRANNIQQATSIFEELIQDGFPAAFVKITRSASGDGTVCVNNSHELLHLFEDLRFAEALKQNEIYIDGLIPYTQSPSVLLNIGSHGYQVLGSNYQILKHKTAPDLVPTVHMGAQGPITQAHARLMGPYIQATARFLMLNGYQGQANVEGLLANDINGQEQFYAIEINARQTGSSIPSLESQIIQKINKQPGTWYCNNNIKVAKGTNYQDIQTTLDEIMFNAETGYGVILSNFGIIEEGKIQLTIHAPNQSHLTELITETTHKLANHL